MSRTIKLALLMALPLLCITSLIDGIQAQKMTGGTVVPRTWDDSMIASSQLPLAEPGATPVQISGDYYYRIPVRPIYKSYRIYAPGKEPPGYLEWLEQQEPQVIEFDTSRFESEQDWIKMGEIVFDAPAFYESVPSFSEVRDPKWYEKTGVPLTKDGIMPFTSYVIREKGKIEVGNVACGLCHTRLMPDGTIIKGAQGNFPFDRADAIAARRQSEEAIKRVGPERDLKQYRLFLRGLFAAPWLKSDPNARTDQMTLEEILAAHEAIPAGVLARQGSSLFYPAQVPDLIGIKDYYYLDHTGLVVHRSIGDLMRYAAFNQGGEDLAHYGAFYPYEPFFGKTPDPKTQDRYSDEQLYALALYVYSLKPPPNPNKMDAVALRGKNIFYRQGCDQCHTPPLYTNNKLTPVEGFTPAKEHFDKYDILPVRVGTDSNLALNTRRGTGYYKVPSLRGVWYRGPFEHNGSVATLEDWLDPRRLRDDYVPTAFKGYGVKARAVKGHSYGLDVGEKDRKALIAFLKTL